MVELYLRIRNTHSIVKAFEICLLILIFSSSTSWGASNSMLPTEKLWNDIKDSNKNINWITVDNLTSTPKTSYVRSPSKINNKPVNQQAIEAIDKALKKGENVESIQKKFKEILSQSNPQKFSTSLNTASKNIGNFKIGTFESELKKYQKELDKLGDKHNTDTTSILSGLKVSHKKTTDTVNIHTATHAIETKKNLEELKKLLQNNRQRRDSGASSKSNDSGIESSTETPNNSVPPSPKKSLENLKNSTPSIQDPHDLSAVTKNLFPEPKNSSTNSTKNPKSQKSANKPSNGKNSARTPNIITEQTTKEEKANAAKIQEWRKQEKYKRAIEAAKNPLSNQTLVTQPALPNSSSTINNSLPEASAKSNDSSFAVDPAVTIQGSNPNSRLFPFFKLPQDEQATIATALEGLNTSPITNIVEQDENYWGDEGYNSIYEELYDSTSERRTNLFVLTKHLNSNNTNTEQGKAAERVKEILEAHRTRKAESDAVIAELKFNAEVQRLNKIDPKNSLVSLTATKRKLEENYTKNDLEDATSAKKLKIEEEKQIKTIAPSGNNFSNKATFKSALQIQLWKQKNSKKRLVGQNKQRSNSLTSEIVKNVATVEELIESTQNTTKSDFDTDISAHESRQGTLEQIRENLAFHTEAEKISTQLIGKTATQRKKLEKTNKPNIEIENPDAITTPQSEQPHKAPDDKRILLQQNLVTQDQITTRSSTGGTNDAIVTETTKNNPTKIGSVFRALAKTCFNGVCNAAEAVKTTVETGLPVIGEGLSATAGGIAGAIETGSKIVTAGSRIAKDYTPIIADRLKISTGACLNEVCKAAEATVAVVPPVIKAATNVVKTGLTATIGGIAGAIETGSKIVTAGSRIAKDYTPIIADRLKISTGACLNEVCKAAEATVAVVPPVIKAATNVVKTGLTATIGGTKEGVKTTVEAGLPVIEKGLSATAGGIAGAIEIIETGSKIVKNSTPVIIDGLKTAAGTCFNRVYAAGASIITKTHSALGGRTGPGGSTSNAAGSTHVNPPVNPQQTQPIAAAQQQQPINQAGPRASANNANAAGAVPINLQQQQAQPQVQGPQAGGVQSAGSQIDDMTDYFDGFENLFNEVQPVVQLAAAQQQQQPPQPQVQGPQAGGMQPIAGPQAQQPQQQQAQQQQQQQQAQQPQSIANQAGPGVGANNVNAAGAVPINLQQQQQQQQAQQPQSIANQAGPGVGANNVNAAGAVPINLQQQQQQQQAQQPQQQQQQPIANQAGPGVGANNAAAAAPQNQPQAPINQPGVGTAQANINPQQQGTQQQAQQDAVIVDLFGNEDEGYGSGNEVDVENTGSIVNNNDDGITLKNTKHVLSHKASFSGIHTNIVTRMNTNTGPMAAGDELPSKIIRGFWISTLHGKNKQKSGQNLAGYRGLSHGGSMGFDVEINNSLLGISYSRVNSKFRFDSKELKQSSVTSHVLTLYGEQKLSNKFSMHMISSLAHNHIYDVRRNNEKYTKLNKRHNNHFMLETMFKYHHVLDKGFVIIPSLGLQYDHARITIYSQDYNKKAKLSLKHKHHNTLAAIGRMKIDFPEIRHLNALAINPSVHAGIDRMLIDKKVKINNVSLADKGVPVDNSFIIPHAPRNSYNLGSTINFNYRNTQISAGYNNYFRRNYKSHEGFLKITIKM